MISIQDALQILEENLPEARIDTVDLADAHGRYLVESITAPEPSPRYTNSAMDGYAVRWADVMSASRENPVKLKLIGESMAGTPFAGEVKAGEGVFGLRRAFALSGARNLMMSLWPVNDSITAGQMRSFYRFYGKGTSPAEALRKAQLETIATLRKRFGVAPASLWAPFILQGPPVSRLKKAER